MTLITFSRFLACFFLAHAGVACANAAANSTQMIRETGQGQVDFASDEIRELSGITPLGHDQYVLVSDKDSMIGVATIKIHPETGRITHATLDQTIKLQGGGDLEDLAFDPTNRLLATVDEADQSISYYHFPSGRRLDGMGVPDVFKRARPNLGFEALSAERSGLSIWAANEEALKGDGPASTQQAGTLVRLQRYDADRKPAEQFAYRTDPHRGSDNLAKRAQCGVVGLVVLPGDRVIVMERELGGSLIPSFRIRLYLIDPSEATETSKHAALAEHDITPVRKQLLFETNTGLSNFEGVTLGPRLGNGDYAMLLVSDDGGGEINPQRLIALRVPGGLVDTEQPAAAATGSDASRATPAP